MSSKYRINDHQSPHFISFATVQWVDALTRPVYKDIILESLKYCQKEKGLIVYAWVIMTNHVHLIISAKEEEKLSNIIRDFKRHTSKTILKAIEENNRESRRSWMLWIFKKAGEQNSNNKNYQFWQQDNHPIELSTIKMVEQRLVYLHENPVVEGIVREAEEYLYSSAKDYSGGKGLLEIEFIV